MNHFAILIADSGSFGPRLQVTEASAVGYQKLFVLDADSAKCGFVSPRHPRIACRGGGALPPA
jgi:hypothetical protein